MCHFRDFVVCIDSFLCSGRVYALFVCSARVYALFACSVGMFVFLFLLQFVCGKVVLVTTPVSKVLAGEMLVDGVGVLVHISFSGLRHRLFMGEACPYFLNCACLSSDVLFLDNTPISRHAIAHCLRPECVGNLIDVAGTLDLSPVRAQYLTRGFIRLSFDNSQITMKIVGQSYFFRYAFLELKTMPDWLTWTLLNESPVTLQIRTSRVVVNLTVTTQISLNPNVEGIVVQSFGVPPFYPPESPVEVEIQEGKIFVPCHGTSIVFTVELDSNMIQLPLVVSPGTGMCLVQNISIDPRVNGIVLGRFFLAAQHAVEFDPHANSVRFFSKNVHWFKHIPPPPPVQVPTFAFPTFERSLTGELTMRFAPNGPLVLHAFDTPEWLLFYSPRNNDIQHNVHRSVLDGQYIVDLGTLQISREEIIVRLKPGSALSSKFVCLIRNANTFKFVYDVPKAYRFHGCDATDEPVCGICQDKLEQNGSELNKLPCQHLFHTACVSAWLARKPTCPICRASGQLNPVSRLVVWQPTVQPKTEALVPM